MTVPFRTKPYYPLTTFVASRGRANYRAEEVRKLIEEYPAVRESADTTRRGLRFLVALADLDKALKRLPLKYWEVVLLHGLIGIPQAETAAILQISQPAVSKRYRQGVEEVEYLLNGGE